MESKIYCSCKVTFNIYIYIYLITTIGYTTEKRLYFCSYCILLDISTCWYPTLDLFRDLHLYNRNYYFIV